jgi:hypothetical protein
MTLPNGRVLSVFARDGEGHVQAPSFSGDAQLVVTLESARGDVDGLVMKAREAEGSFAFQARSGEAVTRTPILSPTSFQWNESAAGMSPLYSGVVNDQN